MYTSRKGRIQGIFLSAAMAMSGHAGADSIRLQASTPYAKTAQVREAVKKDCQLDTKLPGFIRDYASANGLEVKLESGALDTRKGKVLLLEITDVKAAGGGAWSGAKSMSVAGKLYDSGKLVGDFTAMRYSGGGFFGGYKGTCSIVGRCSKTLGKDIATWLEHPAKNAHLGD